MSSSNHPSGSHHLILNPSSSSNAHFPPPPPNPAPSVALYTTLPHKSSANEKQEFLEVKSVSLEWKLSNLKHIFDSSKGDAKSKCVKSAYFGDGTWQVFFYPNSGHEQYCSIYLSCQPTLEELNKAASQLPMPSSGNGPPKTPEPSTVPWHREGLFKFTFEIKSLDRRTTYKTMEANDHAFSHEARNWGWAQYWRRHDAYYSNSSAKYSDAFLICCTIVYSPTPPLPAPEHGLQKPIPIDLLLAYSSMFNDPLYSDVCFEIIRPRRLPPPAGSNLSGQPKGKRTTIVRRLYASKKVLIKRSEYFMTMFASGFAESGSNTLTTDRLEQLHQKDLIKSELDQSNSNFEDETSEGEEEEDELMEYDSDDFDDLEDPEEAEVEEVEEVEEGSVDMEKAGPERGHAEIVSESALTDQESSPDRPSIPAVAFSRPGSDIAAHEEVELLTSDETANVSSPRAVLANSERTQDESNVALPPVAGASPVIVINSNTSDLATAAKSTGLSLLKASPSAQLSQSITGAKVPQQDLKRSFSTKNRNLYSPSFPEDQISSTCLSHPSKRRSHRHRRSSTHYYHGRKMTVVEVTDAACTTFKALLFFLYTDSIAFAPLSSTYHCAREEALENGLSFDYKSKREYVDSMAYNGIHGNVLGKANGQRVICSAKTIYRLADKLNLTALKERAYEHITRSLTVQNIPIEVFSSFTSAYEEVRKLEVGFMLSNWSEVRESRSMKKVLNTLRDGGKVFPGFSEIWGILLANLEYRPKPGSLSPSSNSYNHPSVGSSQQQEVTDVGVEGLGGHNHLHHHGASQEIG